MPVTRTIHNTLTICLPKPGYIGSGGPTYPSVNTPAASQIQPTTLAYDSQIPTLTVPCSQNDKDDALLIDPLRSEQLPTTLVGKAILQLVSRKVGATTRTNCTKEGSVSWPEAKRRLTQLVREMWAATTLSQRQDLWRRLHTWASKQGLPINPDVGCLFVVATGVKPQGMLQYTKSLSAVFGKMGINNRPLCSLASAIRSIGGEIPETQATPLSKLLLLEWAREQTSANRLTALVAWKTVSRWGEVATLTSNQFILVTPSEVIIDWFRTPKGRKARPFKPSRFTVIRGEDTKEISDLYLSCAPFERMSSLTTERLDALWAESDRMRGYSGHSIKRGAASELYRLISDGTPIPLNLVDRIQKHEEVGGDNRLNDMSIRYGANPIHLARVLKTGEVTKHL